MSADRHLYPRHAACTGAAFPTNAWPTTAAITTTTAPSSAGLAATARPQVHPEDRHRRSVQ